MGGACRYQSWEAQPGGKHRCSPHRPIVHMARQPPPLQRLAGGGSKGLRPKDNHGQARCRGNSSLPRAKVGWGELSSGTHKKGSTLTPEEHGNLPSVRTRVPVDVWLSPRVCGQPRSLFSCLTLLGQDCQKGRARVCTHTHLLRLTATGTPAPRAELSFCRASVASVCRGGAFLHTCWGCPGRPWASLPPVLWGGHSCRLLCCS